MFNELEKYVMRLTKHAITRARERGCQPLSLALIKQFGHGSRTAAGAKVWMANRRERDRILEALKAAQHDFEKPDPLYFVEAEDGAVVTVGRRTKPVRHR